jgi:peptidoglycan/LPS O-acetylase OafA/YrhL
MATFNNVNTAARIREIDGLRGVAILSVVTLHLLVIPLTPILAKIGIRDALSLLAYGVDLFFVISGFLIGGILLKLKSPSGVRAFYIRRILRIWPLYYFLLFLVYGSLPNKNALAELPYWSFPLFIFNLWQGFGHWVHQALGQLWSVAIEEQFYFIGPILFFLVDRRRLTFVLLACIILSPILRLAMVMETSINPWKFTPTRIDGICLGLLLAIFLSNPANVSWVASRIRKITFLAVLLTSSLVPGIILLPPVIWESFGHSLVILAFGCVVLVIQVRCLCNMGSTFLDWAPLRYLGLRCYSIYLFHMYFSFIAESVSDRFFVSLIISVIVILLFASFSWRYVEAPLINLGRKFSY